MTEIKRSYEVITTAGGVIYKLMYPSQMQKITSNPTKRNKLGWATIRMVGDTTYSFSETPKPIIEKNRSDWGFMTSYNPNPKPRRQKAW